MHEQLVHNVNNSQPFRSVLH